MSKFTQYYTASDAIVLVESSNAEDSSIPVLLDKLTGIAFSENIVSRQIYGIGSTLFGFSPSGVTQVSGQMTIPITDVNYLLKAILSATTSHKEDTRELSYKEFQSLSMEQVTDIQNNIDNRAVNAALVSNLHDLPFYFNIRIVLNNGTPYHKDSKNNGILLKEVRIMSSSTGITVENPNAIVDSYSFIARKIETL